MNNDELATLESVVMSRRTIHSFKSKKVSESLVEKAIEIACWAPNHYLTEPWKFYLLGEKAQNDIINMSYDITLASKGSRVAQIKRSRWQSVPGWLVLTSKKAENTKEERENYAACCCAAQNFMLYLWTKNIGVKWTTGDITETLSFSETVGFDGNHEAPIGMFWYGFPAIVGTQMRQPLQNVLSRV